MNPPLLPKTAFLLTTMGYGNQLLYWEPILRRFIKRVPDCRVYLNKDFTPDSYPGLPIAPVVGTWRHTLPARAKREYNRVITLVDPRIVVRVWRYNPSVLVVSEFGLLTMYGILVSLLRPSCRTLLLVESDPGSIKSTAPWVRRLICRLADRILTNNDAGERYLLDTLKVDRHKIQKSPYLVSQPGVGVGKPATLADGPEKNFFGQPYVKFLYVGQIAERKGLEHLVQAAKALPENYRNRLRFAIVGDGDPTEKKRLIQSLREAGIEELFHFFGRRTYLELEHIYQTSDVFVFPTLNDYRALVGFEAISYGLPVLISRYDGAYSEVVDEGNNGWTFDPLQTSEFAEKLRWFADNPMRLPALGARSKEISSRFTVEGAANALADAVSASLQQ